MDDNDYFEELYSNSVLKTITIGFFLTGVVLGLTFELGIIWYEKNGNHRYRTVINQLFATVSWIVIAYIVLVFIPEGIRYVVGPLNSTFCDIHNFLKNWICSSLLLTFDCIIVLRYIFIFRATNFAVINDNLATLVLQMSILLIGFWISFVNRMSIGNMSLNYYLCYGKHPSSEHSEFRQEMTNSTHETLKNATNATDGAFKKLDTTSIVGLISFIIHIVLLSKISLYQRKIKKETENIQLGSMHPLPNSKDSNKNGTGLRVSNAKSSMADLFTLSLSFMFLSFYSCILTIMHWYLEPAELNTYRYRWIVYWNQILGVSVSIIGIAGSYFVRNSSVTKAIWRNIKNSFYCCDPHA